MSVKKYLDYAGLQRYDDNWKLKFQEMTLSNDDIEDIWNELFLVSWSFTINTEATTPGEKKTGIPLNLYEQTGVKLTVDWGDETKSVLTPSLYDVNDSTPSVHEYAEAGIYQVTIKGDSWKDVYLLRLDQTITASNINNAIAPLYWWRRTLVNVNTIIPEICGTNYYSSATSTSTLGKSNTSLADLFSGCSLLQTIPSGLFDNNVTKKLFFGCFYNCSSLQTIPHGLFDNCTEATQFYYCFYNCSSITSIPSGLFDSCIQVTFFDHCFDKCSSLTSIPSGLFDNCVSATDFKYCFEYCSSITSIPSGLFDNCIAAKAFEGCFLGCSSLASIPEDLFKYNTAVTTFGYCFYNCSTLTNFTLNIGSELVTTCSSFVSSKANTTRTVNVPSGSTTQTAFNNVASSLGLTIVGV